MNDPIANMLTSLRNASLALVPQIQIPHSRLKEGIAHILKKEGFIQECAVEGNRKKSLKLTLKFEGRKGVIEGLKRTSSPGLRRYIGATEIPRVLGGMGTVILSTPKGLMTGTDARRRNLGGEMLCMVW